MFSTFHLDNTPYTLSTNHMTVDKLAHLESKSSVELIFFFSAATYSIKQPLYVTSYHIVVPTLEPTKLPDI